MKDNEAANDLHIQNSQLYKEFQEEREEIMRHKWFESERAGYDIGFERALTDWRIKHRTKWLEGKQKERAIDQNTKTTE